MRTTTVLAGVAAIALTVPHGAAEAQKRKTPYYASISAGQARMRTGPGRNYPVSWFYQRSGLPVKVVDIYKEWRKVEDPGGTQGWIQGNLLTDKRTAMIIEQIVELRTSPASGSHMTYRAEPGVIGRVSKCASGWCLFDVKGRAGYVEAVHLWGVDPGESVE